MINDNNTNTKNGECEDCGHISKLVEEPACGDYHTAGCMCCVKYVCADGCRYSCNTCKKVNRIELFDGYIESFECYNCGEETKTNCTWWGNSIPAACQRYCGCNLSSWNGVVNGTKLDEFRNGVTAKMNVGERTIEIIIYL